MELASYALTPEKSRGRLYPDFAVFIRSPFQRDRDRLIHSSAFRRLDGKTQVFAYHEGKNYRTRLTHSIEVAQITRTLCKSLNLNEELGEAIALAHDLGHSPFGHAGERGLQNAMKKFGGFDHNIQSLKIMTKLESHYPEFEGLNLTWETLAGTVKHNGPIKKVSDAYLKEYDKKFNLELKLFPQLEAQVAAIADDIAYLNHDIDDGCRADMFSLTHLGRLPFIAQILQDFEKKYPKVTDKNLKIYGVTRNMIARMVFDVLDNTKANIKRMKICTIEDAPKQKNFVVDFSENMKSDIALLRQFLRANFYTNTQVARMDMKSQRIVEELFSLFTNDTKLLPEEIRHKIPSNAKDAVIAETVCTYIANMTDMNAVEEHKKLYDVHTRF